MKNAIKTGVIHQNSINPECLEDAVVDLGWEEAVHDMTCNLQSQEEQREVVNMDQDFRQLAIDALEFFDSSGPKLIGGWKKNAKGIWEPDLSKKPFAAQYDPCDGYVQVVASKFVREDCRWCSQCFPDQGDLAGVDGGVVAYSLPPECYNDDVNFTDLVHVNFLKEGFQEDCWDDDKWRALMIQSHNLMSAFGIDSRRWVPYSNVIELVGHLGAFGMGATLCDEDGHSLDVSCLLAFTGDPDLPENVAKIGHKGRLMLDTDDKLTNF